MRGLGAGLFGIETPASPVRSRFGYGRSASQRTAPGGMPLAILPAEIMRLSVSGGGEEIRLNAPRWMACSNAVTAGPNLAVE